MTLFKQIFGGVTAGIVLSTLVHAGLGGGLYYTLKVEPSPSIVAELDLSTSLLPAAPPPPPPPPPPAPLGSGSAPAAGIKPGPSGSAPVKQEGSASPSVREKTAKPERAIAPVFSEAPTRLPEVVEFPSEETEAPPDEVMSVDETETPAERDGGEEEVVSVASVESGPLPEMDQGEPAGTQGVPGDIPSGDGVPGGVLGGEPGGVPGGVPGGQIGGIVGGQLGGVLGGQIGGVVGGQLGGVLGGQIGGVVGGQLGGVLGGSIGGSGRFLSASQVAQLPRWIGNHITPSDYPRSARREGKDGRVLLSVFIDAAGRVRDVRLLQGSDKALNEVALRKVREAIFTPAYNQKGEPVACKVTLPIRFHLE